MSTITVGQALEQAIRSSFVRKNEDGSMMLEVRSHYSDRAKTITAGPARLITNVPWAIYLDETTTERGGDRRCDESWETSSRNVRIGNLQTGGFVAYATYRESSGCKFCRGEHLVSLAGETPVLDYGTAFARWAEAMETEAYEYLTGEIAGWQLPASVQHKLDFAVGSSHPFAKHADRRLAWVVVLRNLGVPQEEDLSGIIRSVRTATCKAALRLGWQPSVAKPEYWAGLPKGVTEIHLQ